MKAASRIELDKLKAKAKGGLLMPRAVEMAARDKKNPLHEEYEWNLIKAHSIYLRTRTQELISEYYVVVEMQGSDAVRTRHFVSLTSDRNNGGGYRAIADVLSDKTMTRQLIADALAELASFQAKYRRVRELATVFEAIDSVRTAYASPTKKRRPESRAAA